MYVLFTGAVALGKWARNFLVNGATKAPQKQPLQLEHIKDGGYLHAIQDFYSVRPTGVEYFQDKKTGVCIYQYLAPSELTSCVSDIP